MELIINILIYLVVGGLVGYILTKSIMHVKKTNTPDYIDVKAKKYMDKNIEWSNEGICLKKKNYEELEQNEAQVVLEIVDNIVYKEKERQRIENVRNSQRNSGADKVDATGPANNTTKNES